MSYLLQSRDSVYSSTQLEHVQEKLQLPQASALLSTRTPHGELAGWLGLRMVSCVRGYGRGPSACWQSLFYLMTHFPPSLMLFIK